MKKAREKFKAEKIDGLFLPHCNFGTEFECARLAKDLNVPVLLWGPLDERPDENGVRLRDTQCGPVRYRKGAEKIPGSLHLHDQLPVKRSGI